MKNPISDEEQYSINIAKLQRTDNETIIRWVNAIAETKPELLKEIESFMKKIPSSFRISLKRIHIFNSDSVIFCITSFL